MLCQFLTPSPSKHSVVIIVLEAYGHPKFEALLQKSSLSAELSRPRTHSCHLHLHSKMLPEQLKGCLEELLSSNSQQFVLSPEIRWTGLCPSLFLIFLHKEASLAVAGASAVQMETQV